MPKILYQSKRFSASSLDVIAKADAIITEYQAQGFALTLRQLYYQFVARDMIENSQRSYKRIGSIVNDARIAGLIDWRAIEDRTRWLRASPHWETPSEIIDSCAAQFKVDRWANQPYRPEVWIEKDALTGVIEPVCRQFDVPYFACRGYVSQSELWRAGQRHETWINAGQIPVVFHLGDHDPSGIDMTRDNADRLRMFANQRVRVERLALNMDQVEQFSPPPNPAKMTDARFGGYVREYGTSSWELDALEPSVLDRLIRGHIETLIDGGPWDDSEAEQARGRARLSEVAEELRSE